MGSLVPLVNRDLQVLLDPKVTQVHLEVKVHRVSQAQEEIQELQVRLDSVVTLDLLDQQAQLGAQAIKVIGETPEQEVMLAHQEALVLEVLMGRLEQVEQLVLLVTLEMQVQQDLLDLQDQRVIQDNLEIQGLVVMLDRLGHRDLVEQLDRLVSLAHQDLPVLEETLGLQVLLDSVDHQVQLDQLDLQEVQVN